VRFRIDGRLNGTASLNRDHGIHLIRHFKAVSNLDPTHVLHLADARLLFEGAEINLRRACAPTVACEKLAIGLLEGGRLGQKLDELGLADVQHERMTNWLAGASGMFLVARPTGCGTTTTAYGLLHELKDQYRSVLTMEEPVEAAPVVPL
jgi:general secretion pathway protein E